MHTDLHGSVRNLWRTTEYHGVLWSIVEYHGVLRSAAEYYRVLRSIADYYSASWGITECFGVYGVLRSIMQCPIVVRMCTDKHGCAPTQGTKLQRQQPWTRGCSPRTQVHSGMHVATHSPLPSSHSPSRAAVLSKRGERVPHLRSITECHGVLRSTTEYHGVSRGTYSPPCAGRWSAGNFSIESQESGKSSESGL
eukprot:gene11170-biopygen297